MIGNKQNSSENNQTANLSKQSTNPSTWTNSGNEEVATLGAGCYWGTENFYIKDFNQQYPGALLQSSVGFMSPNKDAVKNPDYRSVCTGKTTHVEVLSLIFDNQKASYEDVIKFFYTFHDPTTLNAQGNDKGTQYASVIFVYNQEQRNVAQKVTEVLQDLVSKKQIQKYKNQQIETSISDATVYYSAHNEHQRYLENNPDGYCNHRKRFDWKSFDQNQSQQQKQVNNEQKEKVVKENNPNSQVINISGEEQFNKEVLQASKPVMVDCYATWCKKCPAVLQILEEKITDKWILAKIDQDDEENDSILEENQVTGVPHLMIFFNGKKIDEVMGSNQEYILELVKAIEKLC